MYLKKEEILKLLGVTSVTELTVLYNAERADVIKAIMSAETMLEVESKSEHLRCKREKLSKFDKLKYYYATDEELLFHIENCDSVDKVYIFNKFIEIKKFGVRCQVTKTATFKKSLYRKLLSPGDVAPKCLRKSLPIDMLDKITDDSLLADVIDALGKSNFINNIYVPPGFIYLENTGVISQNEAADLFNLSIKTISECKNNMTQEQLEEKFSNYNKNIIKVMYHGEMKTLCEVGVMTGLKRALLYSYFVKGKFKENADWCDELVRIKNGLVVRRENGLVVFEGEETNVYELATRFGKDVKTIKAYYLNENLTTTDIEVILNNGISLKHYNEGYYVDGKYLLAPELAEMFGVDKATVRYLVRLGYTKEEVVLQLKENSDQLIDKSNRSRGVSITVAGVEFVSYLKLDRFINKAENTSRSFINRFGEYKFIESYHVNERLLFKENSPYSEWFADGVWIYKCPVCNRKLLMSTEELINYKHNEMLCIDYEIKEV